MKKYNSHSFKWLLIWIILPILLFFIAMSSVYAYFTATAKAQEGELSTAIIRVGFSEDTASSIVNSNDVITTNVLPGSTIVVNGSVVYTGTMPIYSILEFLITVEGETNPVEQSYFTADGTELLANNGTYTTAATRIATSAESDFQLQFTFDFNQYDNEYMGKGVNIEIVAHAIQAENIDSPVEATNIMMESLNT